MSDASVAHFERERKIAAAVQAACVATAQESYERAAADGLCDEGAWEVAIDALRSINVDAIVREVQ